MFGGVKSQAVENRRFLFLFFLWVIYAEVRFGLDVGLYSRW